MHGSYCSLLLGITDDAEVRRAGLGIPRGALLLINRRVQAACRLLLNTFAR
jgi:hypothetical protein